MSPPSPMPVTTRPQRRRVSLHGHTHWGHAATTLRSSLSSSASTTGSYPASPCLALLSNPSSTSVSAAVSEDGSEETGDGAVDGDGPHASTCAAHSTASKRTTLPIACFSARPHASQVNCGDREQRAPCHLYVSFRQPILRKLFRKEKAPCNVLLLIVRMARKLSPRTDREVVVRSYRAY
jgi:hypothetical protein